MYYKEQHVAKLLHRLCKVHILDVWYLSLRSSVHDIIFIVPINFKAICQKLRNVRIYHSKTECYSSNQKLSNLKASYVVFIQTISEEKKWFASFVTWLDFISQPLKPNSIKTFILKLYYENMGMIQAAFWVKFLLHGLTVGILWMIRYGPNRKKSLRGSK